MFVGVQPSACQDACNLPCWTVFIEAQEPSFRQEALAKIAHLHATPYVVHVSKELDTAQSSPPPDISGAESAADASPSYPTSSTHSTYSPVAAPDASASATTPLLSLEEKRRILAQIVRTNTLDCFDDSGAFDIARAKRILPPGAVRHIAVHETTRTNAEGQPVTERRIQLRLVDLLSALRLDDQLERRRESAASHSHSIPNAHKLSREDFNLIREKTMGLDDANDTIAELNKALDEAKVRERRLSKELDQTVHQLELTQRFRERALPSDPSPSGTALPSDQQVGECDTGCQPVQKQPQTPQPSTQAHPQAAKPAAGAQTSTVRGAAAKNASPPVSSKSPTHSTWANIPPPPSKRPRPPPSRPQPVPRRYVSPNGMLTVTEYDS
jgi:hypothetical protein